MKQISAREYNLLKELKKRHIDEIKTQNCKNCNKRFQFIDKLHNTQFCSVLCKKAFNNKKIKQLKEFESHKEIKRIIERRLKITNEQRQVTNGIIKKHQKLTTEYNGLIKKQEKLMREQGWDLILDKIPGKLSENYFRKVDCDFQKILDERSSEMRDWRY